MNSAPFPMIKNIFKASLILGVILFTAACGPGNVEPAPHSPTPTQVPLPTTQPAAATPTPITISSPEEPICGIGLLSDPPVSQTAPQTPQIALYCQDGATYYFHGSGFKPGEIINIYDVSIISPFGSEMMLELNFGRTDAAGNLVVSIPFSDIEPTGEWQISVSANQGSRASGTFYYAPTQPRITLASQDPNEYGGITYLLLGTGWQPNETLELIVENPSGVDQTAELIAEDVGSVMIELPLAANPDDGDYITTLIGKSQSVSFVITCNGGNCQPQ